MCPQNPDQVVILAAGQGLRLRVDGNDYLKPLYPLRGRPLIDWVMSAFLSAGVSRFNLVVGFERDRLVDGIRKAAPARASINFIDNPHWQLSNGVSLLQASRAVRGRFFLSMADHLFTPAMVELLARSAKDPKKLYLAVDGKIGQVFDLDDATKVRLDGNVIRDIGKGLSRYDAIDTGLFVCPDGIFDALATAADEQGGDCSLSDGVRRMAAERHALAVDIGDNWWQDIDTPEMLANAGRLLDRHGYEPAAARA